MLHGHRGVIQEVPELLHLEWQRVDGAQHLPNGCQVSSARSGTTYRRAARFADADPLTNHLNAFFLVVAQGRKHRFMAAHPSA
ncbi:hypothetical protein D3C75_1097680 [compost metagenome]